MFHRLRIVFAAKKLAQEMKGVDGSFPALPKVAMARYCGSVTFRMATRLQEGQKHKGLNETNTKIKEKMIISLSKSDILVYYQMSCNFNRYFLFNSICPGKWVEYSQIVIESVFWGEVANNFVQIYFPRDCNLQTGNLVSEKEWGFLSINIGRKDDWVTFDLWYEVESKSLFHHVWTFEIGTLWVNQRRWNEIFLQLFISSELWDEKLRNNATYGIDTARQDSVKFWLIKKDLHQQPFQRTFPDRHKLWKKRQCQNLHLCSVCTRIFVILHFKSKKCIVVLGKCFHRIAKSMFEVDDVEYVNILMEEIFFFLFFFTKEKNALQISLRMPSCPCPVFLYMKVCPSPFSVQLFRPFAFSFFLQGNIHLGVLC